MIVAVIMAAFYGALLMWVFLKLSWTALAVLLAIMALAGLFLVRT